MRTFVLTFCTSISLFAAGIQVDGLIVRIENMRILVAHRPITGYMPAMVMPFEVPSAKGLRPGMRVHFEIERGDSKARKLRVIGEDLEDVPKPPLPLSPGDLLPAVKLTDHRTQRFSIIGDRPLIINFIYTRCPLPNVCPSQSAMFSVLAKKFEGRARFASVTLDPEFDTPERLAEYAQRWSARNWSMLTGSPAEIRKLAEALGVVYWPEEGVLAHSSATVIINREGRLVALVEGASHRLDQIVSLIGVELEAP